jgi:dTDP-4-amino-4,6-dideoxygalactose transaminase
MMGLTMTLGFLKKTELDIALQLLTNTTDQTYYFQVKNFLKKKYHKDVRLVNSGSEALYRVFKHIKPKMKGKKILIPAYTCHAAVSVAVTSGLRVLLIDIIDNFGINIELCEKVKNVGAILAVHPYGIPLDIKHLREVAEDKSAILIEDCAQSYNAKVDKKEVGLFGDYSILSFRLGKHISGITGGAILSEDKVGIFEKGLSATYLKSEIEKVNRMLAKRKAAPNTQGNKGKPTISRVLESLTFAKKIWKPFGINMRAYAHMASWQQGKMGNVQAYLTYTQLMNEKRIINERNRIAQKILSIVEEHYFLKPEIKPNSHPSFIDVPLLCKNRKKVESTLRKNAIFYERTYDYSNIQLFPFLDRIGGKKSILTSKNVITFRTDPFYALYGNYDKLETALANV